MQRMLEWVDREERLKSLSRKRVRERELLTLEQHDSCQGGGVVVVVGCQMGWVTMRKWVLW